MTSVRKLNCSVFVIDTRDDNSRGSLDGIATRYALNGPGEGEISAPLQIGTGAQPSSCTVQWVSTLSRGLTGKAVASITQPHLAQKLNKEWGYTSTPTRCLQGML
jgi:hypothetical protein